MLFPSINKHKVFKCSTEHLKYNSMYFFHINIYNEGWILMFYRYIVCNKDHNSVSHQPEPFIHDLHILNEKKRKRKKMSDIHVMLIRFSSLHSLQIQCKMLELQLRHHSKRTDKQNDSCPSGSGRSGNTGMSISPSSIFRASAIVGLKATIT